MTESHRERLHIPLRNINTGGYALYIYDPQYKSMMRVGLDFRSYQELKLWANEFGVHLVTPDELRSRAHA
jgi:hypothetical protein